MADKNSCDVNSYVIELLASYMPDMQVNNK